MRYNIIDQIFHLKSVCISKEENIRKELGLSPAEFRGIMAMVQGSDIPCSLLSRKMGLSVSRGSRVTDKLLKGGYLKLTRNESDKRVISAALTDKGFSVQLKIHQMFEDCERMIMNKMTEDEIKALKRSLIKISDCIIDK